MCVCGWALVSLRGAVCMCNPFVAITRCHHEAGQCFTNFSQYRTSVAQIYSSTKRRIQNVKGNEERKKKHTKIQTNPDHGQGQRDGPPTTVEGETRFSRTRAQSALSDPNVPGWIVFCVAFLCLVCPFLQASPFHSTDTTLHIALWPSAITLFLSFCLELKNTHLHTHIPTCSVQGQ